ncbi:MAG TPA: ABC transporter ATP-binding protein [Gaiellaceae bacterium]|nr:ABC transporter ATP-binding protein [Gaiellaceae bacterium]
MDRLALDISIPLRTLRVDLGLEVGRETVALVGPSGAGKTTVLRAIAGLVRPERGRISLGETAWLDTERGINRPPEERSVGYLFQDYALFPHMSVRKNVAFGGATRVDELLERFGIRHLARERPGGVSGGERQRVALARAVARDPSVLLLDEPLSALDAHTRTNVRAELHELLREVRLPTVIVTHDFEDAAALADRIGVILDGKLLQSGTATELVRNPADPFVASLTGSVLLAGRARPGADGLTEVVLDDGTIVYSAERGSGRVGVVVHPWEITLAREAPTDSARNHLRGPVAALFPDGDRVRVKVGQLTAEITAAAARELELAPGEVVVASFKATGARLVPLAEAGS